MLALGMLAAAAMASCTEEAPIAGGACTLPEHPCPDGYFCIGGSCQAEFPLECTGDQDCLLFGIQYRCLTAASWCVQCFEASHCPGTGCLLPEAICGCRLDAECATGFCDTDSLQCVGCKADSHCPDGVCEDGTCRKFDDDRTGRERTR